MIGSLKSFIARLQNLNEAAKKRWLVVLSAGAMAIVVGLWLVYFNLMVPKLPAADSKKDSAAMPKNEALESLKRNLAAGWEVILEKLGRKNFLSISSAERNFILEGLENVKPTTLP